jgi:succinyl-diaminopimelate desuccinylase
MDMPISLTALDGKVDAVSLTKELIRIPSLNPPGNEEACARFMADVLESIGFEVKLHQFGEGRFNLIADLPGRGDSVPIGFTGHLDTVPLGNARWTFDPFSAHEIDGKIYGRGASDMKAGIAAFISACSMIEKDLERTAGIHIVLTGGEETGCDGAKALTHAKPSLVQELSLLIVGEPTANYPILGHKGALWLRGAAEGKTVHGSMPEQGVNAIYKAVDAIDRLRNFDINMYEHPLMGHATLNVGTIKGGLNINSVPDHAEFEVDIRSVPGVTHGHLCNKLADVLAEDGVDLSVVVDVPPMNSDINHPVVRRVFSLCAPYHAERLQYRSVPFFTDGSVLGPLTGNPPAIILGPGEPKTAHMVDEYCEVERINEAVEIYKAIIQDQCYPSDW